MNEVDIKGLEYVSLAAAAAELGQINIHLMKKESVVDHEFINLVRKSREYMDLVLDKEIAKLKKS